jgi:hypothetical protein
VLWIGCGPVIRSWISERNNWVISIILIRLSAIVTQVAFSHSLRIRMNAGAGVEASEPSTPATPDDSSSDSASVAASTHEQESTTAVGSESVSGSTDNDGVEVQAGVKKVAQDDAQMKTGDQSGKAAQQMIGKINNLVTSDLNSISSVCHFSYIGETLPCRCGIGR